MRPLGATAFIMAGLSLITISSCLAISGTEEHPSILSIEERLAVLGGECTDPSVDCNCEDTECSRTAPAGVNWKSCSPWVTETCGSENGSPTNCWKIELNTQKECSLMDPENPEGCATSEDSSLACAFVWRIAKAPEQTCQSICMFGTATACGDVVKDCLSNNNGDPGGTTP